MTPVPDLRPFYCSEYTIQILQQAKIYTHEPQKAPIYTDMYTHTHTHAGVNGMSELSLGTWRGFQWLVGLTSVRLVQLVQFGFFVLLRFLTGFVSALRFQSTQTLCFLHRASWRVTNHQRLVAERKLKQLTFNLVRCTDKKRRVVAADRNSGFTCLIDLDVFFTLIISSTQELSLPGSSPGQHCTWGTFKGFPIHSVCYASSLEIRRNWLIFEGVWRIGRRRHSVLHIYAPRYATKYHLESRCPGIRCSACGEWGGFPEICPLDTGKFSICPKNIKIEIENRLANNATGSRSIF